MKKLFGLLLVFVAVFAMVSCSTGGETGGDDAEKVYTYNDYTTVSPSNWNELTYQDSNDTQIMSYINGGFFEYNFVFDAKGEIVPGKFAIQYSAATKIEDVTADYVGEKWGIEAGASSQAFKITLREDLKWDDGTQIKAEDFVYTMKQQLDPAFQNYRADSYYIGSVIIHNAKDYVYQGQAGFFPGTTVFGDSKSDFNDLYFDASSVEAFSYIFEETDMAELAAYKSYFQVGEVNVYDALIGYYGEDRTPMTQEIADMLASLFGANGLLGDYWGWADEEITYFSVAEYTYPAMDFEEVGLFVGDTDYELVIVMDAPVELIDEEGNLTYHCGYDFGSLPLVHRAKYEANKVAPTAGNDLWTTTYNQSVESTASWGPYKLSQFQAGKYYLLERNPYWYGYNMKQYEGQYQTDRISCETIGGSGSWNTAWLKFRSGEIDGIGIDVSIADEYKTSARAYFTPSDYIQSFQLQSNEEQLAARESEGVNKTILTYQKFRKALSLGMDRAEFAAKCTTSSLAGYGIFNSMHYYDVANGGAYRNTDYARQVLCNIYAVDASKFNSLEEAAASITGYNPTEAKKLIDEAYNECLNDGKISATDKVVLTIGCSTATESFLRQFNFIKTTYTELAKGTQLEGRLEFEYVEKGSKWANDFRAGGYDICTGGWSGAAWNPGYFLLAYLSPSYMYSKGWDTSKAMMTFTFQGQEYTMSLIDWYNCLNGNSGCKYNWSSAKLTEEERLPLIAALEEQVLQVYYTVPLINSYSASLISYKVDYITYEYNTFVGYGGIRYMTYNYSDAEWAETVKTQLNGEIDYR